MTNTAFLISCMTCWFGFVLGTFAPDAVGDRGLNLLRWIVLAAAVAAMGGILWIGDPP